MWGWSFLSMLLLCFNLNLLECKYFNNVSSCDGNKVLILTYWNVNDSAKLFKQRK